MSLLSEVVSGILAAEGAVVDPIGQEILDVVAPPRLQKELNINEFERLSFGPEAPDGAMRVGLESDWADRLAVLLGDRGIVLRTVLDQDKSTFRSRSFDRKFDALFSLDNATYRAGDTVDAWTWYLLVVYRVTAVSDEKMEKLLTICVNESNGADGGHLAGVMLERIRECDIGDGTTEPPDPPEPWPASRIAEWCAHTAPLYGRQRLAPFVAGMERRMARDLDRLHDYHTDLRREAAIRLADAERRPDSERKAARERLRIPAIEREYRAKVSDLCRKYALTLEFEFMQGMRLLVPVRRRAMTLLRRKGRRAYHLDWNPVSRAFDPLTCEACGATPPTQSICDAALHILCPSCHAPCPECRKPLCRACHPDKCPSCGTVLNSTQFT